MVSALALPTGVVRSFVRAFSQYHAHVVTLGLTVFAAPRAGEAIEKVSAPATKLVAAKLRVIDFLFNPILRREDLDLLKNSSRERGFLPSAPGEIAVILVHLGRLGRFANLVRP